MRTDHRHEEILSQLAQTGRVGVTSIAAALAVSDETIRRDLKMPEERGLLRRGAAAARSGAPAGGAESTAKPDRRPCRVEADR